MTREKNQAGYKENGEIVTLSATRSRTATPARKTVDIEETLRSPLFVPSVEAGKLPDSLTGNGTQNNVDAQSKNKENFERRLSIRPRTAKTPKYYGGIRFWL